MSTTNSREWRAAQHAALARLEAKAADPAERLLNAVNAARAHGDGPAVTSSFQSASDRTYHRFKAEALQAELEDAAAAYAVATGVDGDALAKGIAEALQVDGDEPLSWVDADEAVEQDDTPYEDTDNVDLDASDDTADGDA